MKLQFLEAGQIVTTHGVRGEMKVLPWADGPDFLLDFNRVRIEGKEYKVESCRIQKSCNLLKSFDQMNSMIKKFSGPGAGRKMKRMRGMGGRGGFGFPGF